MKNILFTLLLLISSLSVAQTTIEGTLIDEHKNTVPFANIYLPDSKNSTISNEDGRFYLVLTPQDKTVIISHLTYQDIRIPINDDFPRTIVLKEKAMQLNEVVIGNQLTGRDVAMKVIDNLEKNHDADPAYYEFFTRVAYYTADWKDVNLVQEYYGRLRHNNNHDTKANVEKSRAVVYNPKGEELQKTATTLSLWGIRADNLLLYKPDFLKQGKLKRYDIVLEGSTTLNGTECYILKYTTTDADDVENKKATAYIDKETYGIVKLITAAYTTNADYYRDRNFLKINGKYVLSSVTEKHHLKQTITTLYNYLTDSKDYKDVDFDRTPFQEWLTKYNKDPDDKFWDNYNHIPLPDN